MSTEEVNAVFENLALLVNGNRALVWNRIAVLADEKQRNPLLSEVVDRLVGADAESPAPNADRGSEIPVGVGRS